VRIIVVEDHDDLREATVDALARMGHGVRGLARAELLDGEFPTFRPHLLVLDLNLPGEDGISLARRFRRSHPGIGIVMVTARNQTEQKIDGYDSGADIYLTKPVSIDEVAAAIHALSRRITIWAGETALMEMDPGEIKTTERARAIHQQLTNTVGKMPTQEELARQYACTYRVLNKEFEKEYGQTISAYMTEFRLNQARKAIVETDMPIKLIASRCGYAHAAAFTVAFQARFGCPPGALRKDTEKSRLTTTGNSI
jgi:DNA-binding response OmpR family regulator